MTSSFDRVRVLWPDHLGLARGKYVPASLADRGVRHCTGTWALGYDRDMTPETTGSHWNEGLPDFDAVYRDGGPSPGLGAEHPSRRGAASSAEGSPFSVSPRAALRRAVADWRALDLEPLVGIEFEAYIFVPDGDGGWKPMDTPGAFVYGTGQRRRSLRSHRRDLERVRRGGDSSGVGQLRVRHAPVRVHAALQRRPARRRRRLSL